MRIPLGEFEQYVRPEPLERGLGLFEGGGVESISHLGNGNFEGLVQDKDGTWHPALQIQADVIVAARCTCDTDHESLCKHSVALVFALETGKFGEGVATRSGKAPKEKSAGKGRGRPKRDPGEPPAAKAPKPPKPPKPPKSAADIIARVPHEELVAFLLQECKLDKHIELRLKAHFADMLPASTPAEVEKRISEIIKAAEGKSGKINKGAMAVLIQRLAEWARESKRYLEAQAYDLAFVAAGLVAQSLTGLLQSTSGATPEAKEGLAIATSTLKSLGELPLPEPTRVFIFNHIFELLYTSSGQVALLKLAARICTAGLEFAKTERSFGFYHDDAPQLTEAHLEMVRRVEGETAAQAFAKKNATARYFLMQEIETARKAGKLEQALKAAQKGLLVNQNNPSRLGFWANLIDEILTEMQDVDGRVELALRIYRLGYKTDRVSLRHIIDIAGTERWVQERSRLIQELNPRAWAEQEAVIALFMIDQDHAGLEAYLLSMSLANATLWSDIMSRRYPEQYWLVLKTLMEKAFLKGTSVSSNLLTNVIRAMVRAKGKAATQALLLELGGKYPQHRVLAEVNSGIHQIMRYMYEGY